MAFRQTKVALARLVFIAIYSVAFIAAGFGHWSEPVFIVEYIVVSVLWLGLLAFFVIEVQRSADRRTYVLRNPAIPLLLLAPLFLFLNWDAVWFTVIIVAYIFELRRHAAGDGFTFSFALIAFVGVLAGLTMAEIENDNPASGFTGPSDAVYWAFGGLLRINTGRAYTPTSEDGRFLMTVVAVCGVIAASMFTARLVSWVIGTAPADSADSGEPSDEDSHAEVEELRAEVARLRAEILRAGEGGSGRGGLPDSA